MKLQELRIRKHLTLSELALKSGYLERSLENLENGNWVHYMSIIHKLSGILGVEATEIDEFKAAMEKGETKPKH